MRHSERVSMACDSKTRPQSCGRPQSRSDLQLQPTTAFQAHVSALRDEVPSMRRLLLLKNQVVALFAWKGSIWYESHAMWPCASSLMGGTQQVGAAFWGMDRALRGLEPF